MQYPEFCGGTNISKALTADNQNTINFYVHKLDNPGSTSKTALYPIPGVSLLSSNAGGAGRAHYYNNGREFAVIGTSFVEIDSGGNITVRGTVADDGLPATISGNIGTTPQLFITSGGTGYYYVLSTNVLTAVASPPWSSATMGDMLDGYFLCLDATTSKLFVSNLLDGATWQTTQFAQRSLASDNWVAMKVQGRYIWLLGDRTAELWYDAGTSPFPLAPYPSGLVQHGCGAPWSVRACAASLCWLEQTKDGGWKAVSAAGFTPDEISSVSMSELWNSYTDPSDAVGDSFTDLGHSFYVVTFPGQDITFAYDFTSQTWTQLSYYDGKAHKAWRPRHHAWAFNQHRILDSGGPGVYHLSSDFGTDVNSQAIVRERQAPTLELENKRIFYPYFELDLESGLATGYTGQGSEPVVMMTWSNDAGKTWSQERWRSAGLRGQYSTRVRWLRCGMGRRRMFKIRMSDPVPWRITGAFIDPQIEGGMSLGRTA